MRPSRRAIHGEIVGRFMKKNEWMFYFCYYGAVANTWQKGRDRGQRFHRHQGRA